MARSQFRELISPERVSDATVKVVFDDTRAGARPTQYNTGPSDPDGVRLEIPVRVENIPAGDFVGPYGVSVSAEGSSGVWHSGWLVFRALHSLAQGKAWMTVYVNGDFYARNQDESVQLSAALNLGLYRRAKMVTAHEWGEAVVPDAGFCESGPLARTTHWSSKGEQGTTTFAYVRVACYSPHQRVGIELRAEPQSDEDELSWEVPFAPFPTEHGLFSV